MTPKSPASIAGFKIGDVVRTVDGEEVMSFGHFTNFITSSKGETLLVGIDRGTGDGSGTAEKVVLNLTPMKPIIEPPLPGKEEVGYKVGLLPLQERDLTLIKPGPKPTEQIGESLTMMGRTIGALFSSEGDVNASHMSSAIGIGNIYYQLLSDPKYGWLMAICFSVSPQCEPRGVEHAAISSAGRWAHHDRPDGNHPPPSGECASFLNTVQVTCVVLLMGFMLYVTFFDFTDLFGKETGPNIKYSFPEIESVEKGGCTSGFPALKTRN